MTPQISVTHLSTFPHGGAGLAASSIHRGLAVAGIQSRFYYRENHSRTLLDSSFNPLDQVLQKSPEQELGWRGRWSAWWHRKRRQARVRRIIQQYEHHLRGNDRQTEVFSQAEMVDESWWVPSRMATDVLHLHWTAFAFDWPSFFASLPKDLPIVWTLHDQNPLTGGCHFASGCDRFRSGCGNCPQLRGPHDRDLSAHSFQIKKASLSGRPLHVVAPSRWLLEQARMSPIFQQAQGFHHIPYGIDPTAFAPEPWSESGGAARLLPTILFGAEDLENQRKGVRYAIQAVNELVQTLRRQQPQMGAESKLIRLWTFGKKLADDTLDLLDPAVVLKQWGFVEDRLLQGRLYRAADVFWLPSLEDNQPQTALEAMACGTPVVAFQVGGVPEIVRHTRTGWIVAPRDAKALAQATVALLSHPERLAALGSAAERMVREEFSPQRQAQSYAQLYRQILGYERPSNPAEPMAAEIHPPEFLHFPLDSPLAAGSSAGTGF